MSDLSRGVEFSSEASTPFHRFDETISSVTSDESAPPPREGLPASYRMRADKHYVDQLDAPPVIPVQMVAVHSIDGDDSRASAVPALVESIARVGLLEPLIVQKRDRRYRVIAGRKRLTAAIAAGLREVPCLVHRIGDDEARTLADAARVAAASPPPHAAPVTVPLGAMEGDLAHALSSVLSCTALLSDAMPALTRAVAVDMIRAEVGRAACTLHAARVLRHGVPSEHRALSPRDIMRRVVDTVAPDAQLRGISIVQSVAAFESAAVRADEDVLVYGLAGAVSGLWAGVTRVHGGVVTLSAVTDTNGVVTFSATQEFVSVSERWPADAPANDDRHTEPAALVALRRIAAASQGTVTTTRLAHGSRVSLELPLDSSRH